MIRRAHSITMTGTLTALALILCATPAFAGDSGRSPANISKKDEQKINKRIKEITGADGKITRINEAQAVTLVNGGPAHMNGKKVLRVSASWQGTNVDGQKVTGNIRSIYLGQTNKGNESVHLPKRSQGKRNVTYGVE